jgi:hypothetical protein
VVVEVPLLDVGWSDRQGLDWAELTDDPIEMEPG